MNEGDRQNMVTHSRSITIDGAGTSTRRNLVNSVEELGYGILNHNSAVRNSTKFPHLYYEFYRPHVIENNMTKILIWAFYLLLVCPAILLIHCIVRKRFTRWFHMKVLYSGTFLLFVFTFAPFYASCVYEWRFYNYETPVDLWSLLLSIAIGTIMILTTAVFTFLTCRHHRFREVDKIKDKFNSIYMPFRPPLTCSMYWNGYLWKMIFMLSAVMCIDNAVANAWIYWSFSIFTMGMLILVRAYKLWMVNVLDIGMELIDFIVVTMNLVLTYHALGKVYAYFMVVFVWLKSVFVLIFCIVYCLMGWKAWLGARLRRMPENPNVKEVEDYYERDLQDDDFDRIVNTTQDEFFHGTAKEK